MVRTARVLTVLVPGVLMLGSLGAVASTAVAAPAPAAAVRAMAADIDPASRESMRQGYLEVLKPALQTPIGWTGSIAGCDPGAPSAAAQQATLTAVNYFRDLVGVEPVIFDAALSEKAQEAALMMAANGALSHDPPPGWACYTAEGHAAAGKSNLALGNTGASAISAYMEDSGSGNEIAGHRRWIIDPRQTTMGSGAVQDSGSGWQRTSNALYVLDTGSFQPTPASTPEFMPWPVEGYHPIQIEPDGRWSLSAKGSVNFSSPTVTINGSSAGVTVHPVSNFYGPNTLVWDFDPDFDPGDSDRTYRVVVSGITGASTTTYAYDVTLFDAEAVTKSAQTIDFPQPANRTYGAAPSTLSATASSGLNVTFASTTPDVCSTTGTRGTTLTVLAAGACTVTASQAGNASWEPAPQVQRSFTIAKKQVTATALDAARATGEPNPAFEVSWSGFAYGETLATSDVTGSPSCSTTATADSAPGTYPITCTAGSLASDNYSFAFSPGTLTVGQSDTTPPEMAPSGKAFRVALYGFGMDWIIDDDDSGVDAVQQQTTTRTPSSFGALLTGDWEAPSSSEWDSLPEGQTLCLSGRARDTAGNVSGWTSPSCVHTPVDDRSVQSSRGWRTVSSTGLWFGSALKASTTGAKVTVPGAVDVDRVGIVTTRCAGCGKVAIYVGKTKVGVISTKGSPTKTQVVKVLPRLGTPLDGPVKVVVASSGKKVQVDGVVVSGPAPD